MINSFTVETVSENDVHEKWRKKFTDFLEKEQIPVYEAMVLCKSFVDFMKDHHGLIMESTTVEVFEEEKH